MQVLEDGEGNTLLNITVCRIIIIITEMLM